MATYEINSNPKTQNEVQITELQQWLRDHPDASIEAVREVRRKLTELENNQSQINDKR